MRDQGIIDAIHATYVHSVEMARHFLYITDERSRKLPFPFPLIAHELGENDGKKYPEMRLEQWRGWWVCTAPKIKWWWLLARVENKTEEQAREAAMSVTYMQRYN